MTRHHLFPKLRFPIDIRFEEIENQKVLFLNCPLGITKSPLLLVPAVAPILGCFEGQMHFDEILEKFKQYGIQRELLQNLITMLDDHLFLAGPKFEAAERQIRLDFLNSEVRPAALAGLSYSAGEFQLRAEIEKYLQHQNGIIKPFSRNMLGIVAPHIDYRRGSVSYGITYNNLKAEEHDLYILIGTSHQYSKLLFHLSAKDFATPLGPLVCDREFMHMLSQKYGVERSFKDELLHRKEHSLELQTPFLSHLHKNAKIAPILVGGFHRMVGAGKFPHEYEEYEAFAQGLSECLRSYQASGRRACVVAGVDMAHVGMNFGDKTPLTPEFMLNIESRDRLYLDTIVRQDKKAMFSHIAEDQDARRICGFPTMYTVLDVFDRLGITYHAEVFDYRQAVDYKTDCAVTFAGIGMYPTAQLGQAS